MYNIFILLMFGINISIPLYSNDYSLYSCLLLYILNILAYPIYIMFLSVPTVISKPKIEISPQNEIKTSIIDSSKKIFKSSFIWTILTFSPFIVFYLLNQNVFNDFEFFILLVIVSGIFLAVHLLVLSTIFNLYFRNNYWILIVCLGLFFTTFVGYISQSTINLLYLTLILNVLTYVLGLLLTKSKRTLKTDCSKLK